MPPSQEEGKMEQVQFILSCLIFNAILYLYFAPLEQQYMNCHHDWHITNEHIVYLAVYFHFFSEAVGFLASQGRRDTGGLLYAGVMRVSHTLFPYPSLALSLWLES